MRWSDPIRQFQITVAPEEISDLQERLLRTRWPSEMVGVGWTRGVPLDYLKRVADYWRTSYDWYEHQAQLNSYPQFTTTIDGQNIHFLHVTSPERDAVPLIMTHGWPGSVVEFLDVIGPLTDPRSHGADPANAFHLVIPSIPGFGFSGPVTEPGWGNVRIAEAWAQLMAHLGYESYGTQGGDAGALISEAVGLVDPDHVIGVHVNFIPTFPSGDPADLEGLDESEQASLAKITNYGADLAGYMQIQTTRPQTLGYGLTDSPVGQLAWIIEKFKDWTDRAELPEDAVDLDHILTNVMVYWLTATGGSSAHYYYEQAHPWRFDAVSPTVPTGVAVFTNDCVTPVRRWAERARNIVRWTEYDRGGHFAAMENPTDLVTDIREFFSSLA